MKKYAEFCDKLVTVTLQYQNEVENVVKFLHEETLKEESTPEKCNIIWEHVVLLLTQLTNVPTSLNTIVSEYRDPKKIRFRNFRNNNK